MYFWNISGLKKSILENRLSETHNFYYILLFVGVSSASLELVGYFPAEDPSSWDYIQSGLNLIITIVGTVLAYRANGAGAGKNFAGKYFSIGFVVLIRFLVLLIPVFVAIAIYYGLSLDWSSPDIDLEVDDLEVEESFATGWFEVLLISAWYVAYYARVVKHVRDTAKASM